ncbi:MAG: glycosyltransferase family 2 protein [Geobacter sp.]|nr:glycosyltransferase family 2 protein [Geobacter sp.]
MKVSIITVCLNNRTTIKDTIDSVISQTHKDLEYLIIDGGSNDGTLDIIEQYRQQLTKVINGPDGGIYDAMNKGIALATGEVIGLLNADDTYASADVIADVAGRLTDTGADACYGDLVYVDSSGRTVRNWKADAYLRHSMYAGWMPPHPTFFVRRSCYERYGGYRTDLGTSADYELMLRYLLRHSITPVYLPEVLVRMRIGGSSNSSIVHRLKAHLMDWRAWRVNGLYPYPWTVPLKPLRKLGQWVVRN